MKKKQWLFAALFCVLMTLAALLPAEEVSADPLQIWQVTINGVKVPRGGKEPQMEGIVVEQEGVSLDNISWYPDKDLRDGKFRPGWKYILYLEFTPKAGYAWGPEIKADSFVVNTDDGRFAGGYSKYGDKITIGVPLTAMGERTFYVNFLSGGHGTAPAELEVKEDLTLRQAVYGETDKVWIDPVDDFEMTGWYTDLARTTEFTLDTPVTKDLTLYAGWRQVCTVSFDAGGGSGSMEAVKVTKGENYTLPACTFTAPAGKVFDRWDAGAVGAAVPVNENKTLKALWKAVPAATPSTPATPTPSAPATPSASAVKTGDAITANGQTVTVTKVASASENGEITYTKAPNKKKVTVPKTMTIQGKTYNVTAVGAKAFTAKKIRQVTVGANVKKLAKNAFTSSKATKVILKTKLLKKKTVKGCLKKSKVTTVQVKIGSKSVNKKYVKTYKKYFTKKNAGKSVKVK